MSCFEDLSGEILMAIFEYMNVEDVWTIFFNMNTRFHSLVFDSRLQLTADVSKVDKLNYDQFCSSLINKNFSNIYKLILSNHYNRYPQIRSFLSQTTFTIFQSLHALTLTDINHDELIEITQQIKQLPYLNYLHINTHEIFRDKELTSATYALLNQSNIRVSIFHLHERLQWHETETISSCNTEVLSLDYINADRLAFLLPHCSYLRSLSVTLDPRTSLSKLTQHDISPSLTFPQITCLRLCYRPFDLSTLENLLNAVPSVRRFSMETLVYSTDYIRSPFWTLLLQQYLPLLERIRLVVRGWFVLKASNNTNDEKLDEASITDSYRYDHYWLDRAYKHIFKCLVDSSTAVLEIR
ncbi:unnamed protein product [Rotaria magnacalcarata]|uniref:F-box domain-containing protein n=4 Tax=Rotaria magnacalcarata TaxID=392030 RepID=A0A815RI74_9BILA|nr:unnamed protein product [Rotaria magnacalcarata]CAF1477129.1 unnamed protein product [Rotaria magnacalcarata]CAF2249905.1 unnamed protein product [Rotaria magnacalcarata]CAF4647708.1 unnamed protein product [Rotaria magnacalcarata]